MGSGGFKRTNIIFFLACKLSKKNFRKRRKNQKPNNNNKRKWKKFTNPTIKLSKGRRVETYLIRLGLICPSNPKEMRDCLYTRVCTSNQVARLIRLSFKIPPGYTEERVSQTNRPCSLMVLIFCKGN